MPDISVIIPSYNHASFIGEAIQSVLAQSIEDLELVIVDDGSVDDSLEVIQGYTDPRIRLFPQANQGAHSAINRGLHEARGDFLAILNSDDRYHPRRLEKLTGILQQDANCGLVGSYVQLIDRQGGFLGIKHGYHDLEPWLLDRPELSFRAGNDLKTALLVENYWSTTSNFVFRRAWFDRVGCFIPLRYTHDWDFAIRMAHETEIFMLDEPLLYYRVHDKNTIRDNRAAMIFEICWILAVHLPVETRCPWFGDLWSSQRVEQLLHSIYTFGCDRVLNILLLQNLSQNPGLAADILNPDHPTRVALQKFIQEQLDLQRSVGKNQSPGSPEIPGNLDSFRTRQLAKEITKRIRNAVVSLASKK